MCHAYMCTLTVYIVCAFVKLACATVWNVQVFRYMYVLLYAYAYEWIIASFPK